MKKTKTQKGITLIALIVTVSVLVILTAVTITTVTNDEIKDKTKNTVSAYEILQEKEKLQNEVMRWDLINNDGVPTLQNYMAGIYGEENVQLNVDNSLTVTVPSGNRYIVTKDGEVTLIDETTPEPEVSNISVSLDKTEITKEIKNGKAVTETIKATLNNATGKLTWFSSDPDVAQIATSEGNERIIKLKKEGTATITVAYAENKNIASTCTIDVVEPVNITLDKTTITKAILEGDTATETITATLDVEGKTVTWSSSNTSVASIEGNGNTATITLQPEGTATITASCGRYSATCTVTITEKPINITLDKTTIEKEIFSVSGSVGTATETITATLDVEGKTVTWSSSNISVASISASGNTATVTLQPEGTATITASCGKYSAICTVTVTEKEIKVGMYVEYDVSYTDMYQGKTYTKSNGWRYLGTDDEGNTLLISTAIPMKLYYHYSTAGGNAKWWDTDTTLNANVRATNGMLNNFDKIPFAQKASGTSMSSGEENTAIGTFAASTRIYDGTEYNAVGDYFKSSTYEGKIEKVRTLTLAELNRAVNSANGNTDRAETSTSSGFLDLTDEALGLFDMRDLTGYSAKYYYWLATPMDTTDNVMRCVSYGYAQIFWRGYWDDCGVRPVVVLSSDVEFVDDNGDGILEIQ